MTMSRLAIAVIVSTLLTFYTAQASAEGRRVALVVGIGAYQTVPSLPNAVNDADAVAEMFRKANFDVVTARTDLGNLEFKRAIRQFEDTVTDSDIAVVFYAGHGIEIRDTNYLIPTDAKLLNERDAEDEAISLDRIISALEPAKRLRLVILDACRDNPFAGKMKRRVATRAVSVGLGRVEPAQTDTLIAYASKEKSVANDGEGAHSPFTTALLANLTQPGLDIRLAFGRVRDDVLRVTNRQQEPFVYGSLGGGTVALVPAPDAATGAADTAKADYAAVERLSSKAAWEAFLNTHKTGLYADLARVQMAKLGETTGVRSLSGVSEQPAPSAPAAPVRIPPAIVEPRPTQAEQKAWDKLDGSTDIKALRSFVERFPSSPLIASAQRRIELLEQLRREQEEAQRIQREAARIREEEEKLRRAAEADQRRLEREAAHLREQEERVKAAELARQKAEALAAAKQREMEERAKAAAELAARRLEEERARAAEAELRRREAEARAQALAAERQRIAEEAAARKREADEAAKLAAAAKAAREAEERERVRAAQELDRQERARAAEAAAREKAAREAALAAETAARKKEADARAQALAAERQRQAEEAAAQKREADEAAKLAAAAKAAREAEERERVRAAQELDRQERARAAEVAAREKTARDAALAEAKAAEAERVKREAEAVASRRKQDQQLRTVEDTAEAQKREAAQAAKLAAEQDLRRKAAAKQREAAEQARRVAEEAAANRRKAAEVARKAAEQQAERMAAAAEKRRKAVAQAKEAAKAQATNVRAGVRPPAAARLQAQAAPAPAPARFSPAEIGAARMMSRMP